MSSLTMILIIRSFDAFIPGGLDQFLSIWLSISFSIALNSFLLGICLSKLLLFFNFCSDSFFSFFSKLSCGSKGNFSLAKFFNKSSNFSSLEFWGFSLAVFLGFISFLGFSFSLIVFFGFISFSVFSFSLIVFLDFISFLGFSFSLIVFFF